MKDAKTRKPDLTRPTREQLREAYELAREVADRAPWKSLHDSQVLAVRFADGRERFVSVMGRGGGTCGISAYMTYADFHRMKAVDGKDHEDAMDGFFSTNQLMLAFDSAEFLLEGEMEQVLESGVRFDRRRTPSFMSYFAGLARDRMGAAEIADALASIRALLAFLNAYGPDAIALRDAPMQLLTTWTELPDGSWVRGENEFSWLMPFAFNLDGRQMRRVAAMPIKKKLAIEVATFVVPMGRTPQGRGKMSRFALIVDRDRGTPLGMDIFESPDEGGFDWSPVLKFVLDTLLKLGCLPGRLAVFGMAMNGILKRIVETELKGVEFLSDDRCELSHQVFKFLQRP